ncbi:MAG: hypothetical protein KDA71_24070, partial [Planctomycetales bacterium]|nr:hypothetical protein [Planctomycetales bacterium]
DYWKLWVQKRLVSDRHLPGSLGFYRVAGGPDAQAHEHAKISNHLCNEKFERVPDPKKGIVEKWVKRGQNHWLDAMAMASAAIRKTGFDLSTLEAIELTFEKLEQFEEAAAAGTLEAEQLEVPSVSMSERFAQLRKGW